MAYGTIGAKLNRLLGILALTGLMSLPGAARAGSHEFVIAALGDSLTHGHGLPPEQGFVPRLEAWLNAHASLPVRVVNAGVSGDTTAGGLARIDWTLTDEVDAVIVELGGNDLLRGIDPATVRDNLDGILARIDARGLPVLLCGLPAPLNYGPEYKAEFDAIFPELALQHGAYLYPNFLAALAPDGDPAKARAFMQADGIHPDAEGVKRIVEDIGPLVLEMIEEHAPES
ncbi:MAG: arylesterase [Alphaproteobacteria bacterium]|nr:MAG: arylesterase [Alphaproteobacteria bacterium]